MWWISSTRQEPEGTAILADRSERLGQLDWFGGAFQSLVWDSASAAGNNPSSGSMKITANFNGGNNQFEIYNGPDGITPALNGLQYTNFQCDVRFDPVPARLHGQFAGVAGDVGGRQFPWSGPLPPHPDWTVMLIKFVTSWELS
jgi:hypothetical protein